MKIFICFVLLFALVNCETSVLLAPGRGTKLVVNAQSVRVRAGPCTDQRIITTVNTGLVVESLGESKTGCGHTWWKVKGPFGEGLKIKKKIKKKTNSRMDGFTIFKQTRKFK